MKLKDLAPGTVFQLDAKTWQMGSTAILHVRANTPGGWPHSAVAESHPHLIDHSAHKCDPKLGGQFQPNAADWLSGDAEVTFDGEPASERRAPAADERGGYCGRPNKWHLRDWKLPRLKHFEGIADLRDTGIEALGYYLRLDFSMQYREFLITDNGGEVNIREIGRTNDHFDRSMELPITGTYAQTNEAVLYYRLMRFIKNEPIDWEYEDSTLTEEDFQMLHTSIAEPANA